MTGWMPEMAQLRGYSLQRAELFGKPHAGCRYVGSGWELTQERCCVCGRPAANCHHVMPRGRGKAFQLSTPAGKWQLKSPLFAVCGSGTTGCHDGFHGGAFLRAEWVWDRDVYQRAWWSGELLEVYEPHDEGLYEYGHWAIADARTGRVIEIGA